MWRTARGGQSGDSLILDAEDHRGLKAWQLAVMMRSSGSRTCIEDRADRIYNRQDVGVREK